MLPSFLRIQDLADILIMTFLLYQLYSWFRKTRAMQVLLGLGVLTLIYFVTRFFDLYMTSWIFHELGTVLIILLIVVFQAEIRQTLYRFSLLRTMFDPQEKEQHSHFKHISDTVFRLAEKRIGALIVFRRNETLVDLMLNGVKLDCEITPQILETIFTDSTPLHDGAALIYGGRIEQAACHLPLSINPDVPQHFGTRHRAALGLTERTDAIVLVVSEERGEVSLAEHGVFVPVADPGGLLTTLEQRFSPVSETTRLTLWQKLFANMLPKTALLLIVTAFWALITSRQGQISTVSAPVRLLGVSDDLVLVRSVPEEVEVQVKTISGLTPTPAKLDISATVDLSDVREGQSSIRIKNSDIALPSGMVVTSVSPASIKVQTEKKMRKKVPVKILLKGSLPAGIKGYAVIPVPAVVEVEGPAGQVSRVESVATEEIDARQLAKGKEYRKNLLQPARNISILRDDSVQVTVEVSRKKQ